MLADLNQWTPRERPSLEPMTGRFVVLEPLDAARHGDGLYAATASEEGAERYRYLFEPPPASRDAFQPWLDKADTSVDPLWFTVMDAQCGQIVGRQSLMRIDQTFGVIEIGNILWSSLMARSPAATEALYLFARHVFDDLGYRRFEWKCNNANEPSKAAAERFGFTFEGVFRQHLIVKGMNRDTAWFAMIDRDWPPIREAFEQWLAPSNFDASGNQKRRLVDIRAALVARAG